MHPSQTKFRSPIGRLCACTLTLGLLAGCSKSDNRSGSEQPANGEGSGAGKMVALGIMPPVVAGADDLYEDVTAKAGITFVHQFCDSRIANIIESNGAGAAILDFDNDGFPDIFLLSSGPLAGVTHEPAGTKRQPNRLYRNRGNGTFEDVTEKAGVGGNGYGIAAAAADYDNDGYTDLYVINVGKSILYHNRGNGTFEDVTEKAGLARNSKIG